MIREDIDCIDAGSEYCPCKLAETGECILCSQLQGKCFCDCINWKGVCIYQEFFNNGNKAKEKREKFNCNILDIKNYDGKVIVIKIKVTHKLALDLINPGSFVFLCPDDDKNFDFPISILESNTNNDCITMAIEIRGIKTKKLLNFKVGDFINIRAPYWNGIFGIKNIEKQVNTNCMIIGRGIGIAPMIPILRKLRLQNCSIDCILDYSSLNEEFIDNFISKYVDSSLNINTLVNGKLTDELKYRIYNNIEKGVNYIHIGGADILTYNIINYLHELGKDEVLLSCCNNFKMCCGEGVCGACTARYKGHKVKRFCKIQTNPRNIFEERRLI